MLSIDEIVACSDSISKYYDNLIDMNNPEHPDFGSCDSKAVHGFP